MIEVKKYSDIGTDEPFVSRLWGLFEILNGTTFDNGKKIKINGLIMDILTEGLMPAFLSLQEIRKVESGEVEKVIVNLEKNYFDLYKYLWVAYKNGMQITVKEIGFDIGFLFQNDKKFEKGAENFLSKVDLEGLEKDVIDMFRNEKESWQNTLSMIRNKYLEHKEIPKEDIEPYLNLSSAELLFDNCWKAIEEILVSFLRTAILLKAGIDIGETEEYRQNKNALKRFQFLMKFSKDTRS